VTLAASKEFDADATVVDAFKAKEISIKINRKISLVEDASKSYSQRDPELTFESGRLTCNLRRVSDSETSTLTPPKKGEDKTWRAREDAIESRTLLVDNNQMTATLQLGKTGEEILLYCNENDDPYFAKTLDLYKEEDKLLDEKDRPANKLKREKEMDAKKAELEKKCQERGGRFDFLSKDQLPKNYPALNTYKLETKLARCNRTDRNTTYAELQKLFQDNGMEIKLKTEVSTGAAAGKAKSVIKPNTHH
jgi:hypothetical protein